MFGLQYCSTILCKNINVKINPLTSYRMSLLRAVGWKVTSNETCMDAEM